MGGGRLCKGEPALVVSVWWTGVGLIWVLAGGCGWGQSAPGNGLAGQGAPGVLAAGAAGTAGGAPASSAATVLTAVTVTATRSAGMVGEHAETVDGLSAAALREYPALTLDESLRQHVGFELFRRAGSRVANPTSEGVSLRGLGSTAASRTLVLEESVPLNDGFGGWVHWDELPPESVGAVTVATGGGSDLYGSSALGGVIDVVPGRLERMLGEIEGSGAGQGTSDGNGRVDRGFGRWVGSAAGQSFRTAGYVPTAPGSAGAVDVPANVHFQNGRTELDRSVGVDGRVFLLGNVLNEARGNGTPLTTNGTRLWRYLAGDDWAAGERVSGRARVFGSDESYRQSFSAIPVSRTFETLTRRQVVRTQEAGLSADAAVHRGGLGLVGGADVRDLRATDREMPASGGVVSSIQDTTARQRFTGGFAEVLYSRGGWSGAGSLRVDDAANLDTAQRVTAKGQVSVVGVPDRSEVVASPRVGVVRRVSGLVSVRAAGFRAFRAPTMNELYRQGQVGQEITQANAQLRSERATGWEAGTNAATPGGRVTGLATFFWTEINRPVSAVLISQTASTILDRRENLGQIRSEGVELKGETRVGAGVTAGAGYQYADAVVTKFSALASLVGKRLPEVPRHSLTAQVRADRGRWGSYTVAMRRSGMVFDDAANTLALRGFFELDVYGERTFGGRWTVFGAVENVLNQRADVSRTPVLTLGSGALAEGGVRVRWGGR